MKTASSTPTCSLAGMAPCPLPSAPCPLPLSLLQAVASLGLQLWLLSSHPGHLGKNLPG